MRSNRRSTCATPSGVIWAFVFVSFFSAAAQADILVGWGSYVPGADLIEETQFQCTQSGSSCSDTAIGPVRLTVSRAITPPNPDIAQCHVQSVPGRTSTRRVISIGGMAAASVYQYFFTLNCPIIDAATPTFDYWAKIGGTWYFAGSQSTVKPSYSGVYSLFGTGTTLNGTPISTALSLPEELRVCLSPGSPLNGGCEVGSTTPGPGTQLATLTVLKAGTGTGTVTGPAGLNCGPTCTASFSTDLTVSLTATASAGSTFQGWSGHCIGTGSTTSVAMTTSKQCVATFTLAGAATATLTVTRSGTGSGTVTSSPTGINCGSTCAASFPSATTVTLTAIPASGSTFAGWTGSCSGQAASVTVSMTTARQCDASFAAAAAGPVPQCTLTATPASINPGQSATLTASCTPAATSYVWTNAPFASSASSGSVSPSTTTSYSVAGRNANGTGGVASATVTVTSPPPAGPPTLTVVKQGAGQGVVSSSPSGIECGSICSAIFQPNAAVALTAIPAREHRFAGWSGDCSGASSTVTVSMSAAKRCVATFQRPSQQLLGDGGFETNSGLWLQSAPSGQQVFPGGMFPHSGQNNATFGPRSGTWSVYTTVQIPSGTTTRLQFWYAILDGIGGPGAPPAVDNLNVTIRHAVTGSLLATIATLTSEAPTPSWVQSTAYDVSEFAGQTVRLQFAANIQENGAGRVNSSFRVDDVSLVTDDFGATAAHTGLWWKPSEAGWGVNLSHQGNVLFATLFTYDAAGKPLWLFMSNGAKQVGSETYSGDLYRSRGAAFDAPVFTPLAAANLTRVGTMSVSFSGNSATLRYSVNGIDVTKTIEKMVFGRRPAVCLTSAVGGVPSNYQDLWWNPLEAGWGLNVAHQDDMMFATLFTYGDDNEVAWFFMSAGLRQRTDMSWKGDLHQTTGPAFNAQPFTSATPRRVGTMEFVAVDENNAFLAYSIDGRRVYKSITRMPLASPTTRCGS